MVRGSALVMAAGVNLVLVLLLISSRARVSPEPLAAAMMWIVVEQSRPPQQRQVRDRTRRMPAQTVEQPAAVAAPLPDTSVQRIAPMPADDEPRQAPAVDWALQSQLAAQRSADSYGQAKTISPLPQTGLAARLCAPRVPGAALQQKMDELLPPPPEPVMPELWPPPGSVKLAGNVIVQILTFSTAVGGKSGRGSAPIRKEERHASSVPDANECD